MQLYPWISVEEISTNEIAEDVSLQTNEETQTGIRNEMTEKVVEKPVSEKESFWKQMFGSLRKK